MYMSKVFFFFFFLSLLGILITFSIVDISSETFNEHNYRSFLGLIFNRNNSKKRNPRPVINSRRN